MALIFLGKSECALCGKILIDGEEVTGLPASSFTEHPLYPYFDRGFHTSCFNNWDKKEEINALIEEQRKQYEASDYYKEMFAKHGKPKG